MRKTSTSKRQLIVVIVLLLLGTVSVAGQTGTTRSRQLEQIGSTPTWPSQAKRWALVIGVDQYADTQITTLGGSANDAKALADALVRYAGFPPDQVFLLSTDQPAERQPTRGNILRRLSNMRSVVPSDGLLLVSYAGHGIERGNQAFLLPSDAQVANDVELLEQTAINVTQMKEGIRKTNVAQVVLILDACRNDPVGRAEADNPLSPAYVRGFNFDVRNHEVTAFATLYATAVGHRAYEFKEKHQGYFTWELIEGLRGGAANAQGEVTLGSLIKYVQDRVPKHVLADLGAGKEQKPFAEVGGYKADQLVIAVVTPRAAATATTNAGSSLPQVDPAAFELTYWETIKNSTDPEDFKSYLRKYPNGQFAELARRRANPSSGPVLTGNAASTQSSQNSGRGVRRAQLGVGVKNIDPAFPSNQVSGVVVTQVDPGTAAERAGIKPGDVLTSINGTPVKDAATFRELVRGSEPGSVMTLSVFRDQRLQDVRATLGEVFEPNDTSAQLNQQTGLPNTVTQPTQTIGMADILALGIDLGMAEITSFQNAAPVQVMQYLTYSQEIAARNRLATQSLDYIQNQLRAGAKTSTQYQNLVAARQGFELALNRNCNCGSVVNLLNVFTLGTQMGFMEVAASEDLDRNYIAKVMATAIQFAAAVGLPTNGLEELLRQLRSGKHARDTYQGFANLRAQFIQATNRACGC